MYVNIVSESVLLPREGGGVHAAFLAHVQMLKRLGVKLSINSLRKADVTHVHTFGPFALYKMFTSKHVVVSSHHLPELFIGSYKGSKVLYGLAKQFFRFYYNASDLVVALNNKTKNDLINLGVTTSIKVLPNAIDIHLFKKNDIYRERMRKSYSIRDGEIVILGAGYVIPRKGIDDFISISKILSNFWFVWVGGSPLKFLASEIKQKKYLQKTHEHFMVTGIIAYADMPLYYNIGDIFFFPSFQETQGLVILEAAATGLPLVLRDLPEYKYLYGKSYIACQTREEFIAAIKLLTKNEKVFRKASKDSLQLAKKFSLEAVGKKLLQYYVAILKR